MLFLFSTFTEGGDCRRSAGRDRSYRTEPELPDGTGAPDGIRVPDGIGVSDGKKEGLHIMFKKSFSQAARTARYVMEMLPTLNLDALFSDESPSYVVPFEPKVGDFVTIRIRTARANVDEVWLVSDHLRERMEFERTSGLFDYYTAQVHMGRQPMSYCFEIISGPMRVILNKRGISEHADGSARFRICPGFSTPDWAKGAVMYQIYTDRFCRGDSKNDVLDDEYCYIGKHVKHIRDWYQRPECMDVRNFYGGDLEGVRQKLDYLKDLGIEAIYFNPLFVSPSNHKYDTQDYDHIDPHFGVLAIDEGKVLAPDETQNCKSERYICRVTKKENLEASDRFFADFVKEAHSRGIRVILDGVFNHCGSFNKWMDREKIYSGKEGYADGAYVSASSPYSDYFQFQEKDPSAWPDNVSYAGWWGHDTLPKLNYEGSEKLTGYILSVAGKWVSEPYCADGWRLDVAADLGHSETFNHRFWKAFRHEVKKANPDALIIAEHYGDASGWLAGDEWDTVMNYDAFMEPVSWFFTGMEKHSYEYLQEQLGNADAFFGTMRYHMSAFMEPSLLCAMNQLSNHDHSRFLTRTNHLTGRAADYDYDAASTGVDPSVMREAVVLQMTWPGAPTLYYGDEAGLTGFTDPDNRRTYPWGREDKEMIAFHKAAIAMHKSHPVLKTGSIKFLGGGCQYLAYARFNEGEQIVCLFNNGADRIEARVPVWTALVPADSMMTRIFLTDEQSYSTGKKAYPVRHGELHVWLKPHSCMVLTTRPQTV